MTEVRIVVPGRAKDDVSEGLRCLTQELCEAGHDSPRGLLGGEYGYGVEYEGDAFTMHPYWWGDCECGWADRQAEWEKAHDHKPDCYQYRVHRDLLERGFEQASWSDGPYSQKPDDMEYDDAKAIEREVWRKWCDHFDLDPEFGAAVHCTCGYKDAYRQWMDSNPHPESCPAERPNFHHHETGFKVWWYKYIGRGMEVENPNDAEWSAILHECLAEVVTA